MPTKNVGGCGWGGAGAPSHKICLRYQAIKLLVDQDFIYSKLLQIHPIVPETQTLWGGVGWGGVGKKMFFFWKKIFFFQKQKGSAKFNKVRRGSTCVQVRTEPMYHPEHHKKVRLH
jgi:hypothetical protein